MHHRHPNHYSLALSTHQQYMWPYPVQSCYLSCKENGCSQALHSYDVAGQQEGGTSFQTCATFYFYSYWCHPQTGSVAALQPSFLLPLLSKGVIGIYIILLCNFNFCKLPKKIEVAKSGLRYSVEIDSLATATPDGWSSCSMKTLEVLLSSLISTCFRQWFS